MKTFKVSSKSVIVTDPCYGRHLIGFCQNILRNVLNGNWSNNFDNVLCAIHEQYKENDLKWEPAEYPCGIDTARIGIYDLEKYDPETNFDEDDKIDWGVTIFKNSDGFSAIEIGYNGKREICGIREQSEMDYFCDQCGVDVNDVRYSCVVCENYDLCPSCYVENKHGHDPASLISITRTDQLIALNAFAD